jgi:cytochrome c553
MMAMIRITAALAAATLAGSTLAAGNIEEGKKKVEACAACHATGGDWTKPLQPEYPKLAGQHRDYLVTALNAYKAADKSVIGRKNAIMGGQVAALSRQDIENIAAYLASLPGPLHIKR